MHKRPLAKDTFARGREKVKGKRGKGFILPFSLNLYPFSDFCKKSKVDSTALLELPKTLQLWG
jgi:hypothetical protein